MLQFNTVWRGWAEVFFMSPSCFSVTASSEFDNAAKSHLSWCCPHQATPQKYSTQSLQTQNISNIFICSFFKLYFCSVKSNYCLCCACSCISKQYPLHINVIWSIVLGPGYSGAFLFKTLLRHFRGRNRDFWKRYRNNRASTYTYLWLYLYLYLYEWSRDMHFRLCSVNGHRFGNAVETPV